MWQNVQTPAPVPMCFENIRLSIQSCTGIQDVWYLIFEEKKMGGHRSRRKAKFMTSHSDTGICYDDWLCNPIFRCTVVGIGTHRPGQNRVFWVSSDLLSGHDKSTSPSTLQQTMSSVEVVIRLL